MRTICNDVIRLLDGFAPEKLAEEWDNVGLLIGNGMQEINRIMVCLDITPEVIEEAVSSKTDMIISHHPLIFKGMKRINSSSLAGKAIYRLIQNNISVYAAHTNLDVAKEGVNFCLANQLELNGLTSLKYYYNEKLYKLVVFVPAESIEEVRAAISGAGAGWTGNYSDCTFAASGIGTFRPLDGTNPYIGAHGKLEKVEEYRLETVVPQKDLPEVVKAMKEAHPYEEVAYDLYPLEIKGESYGLGNVGYLKEPMELNSFIALVKRKLEIDTIRLIGTKDKQISKVAVFCGSFDNDWNSVLKHNVDVLLTGDVKYHDAREALDMGLCVIDAGHFNTEKVIVSKLIKLLENKFPTVDVKESKVEEDPFKSI